MIYSENNITFNNVLSSMVSVGTGGPLTAKNKYRTNEDGTILHRDSDYLINAIDIHWNNAQLDPEHPENVIVSTSDLLNIISSLQQKINELESKYSEIESNLEDLVNNI